MVESPFGKLYWPHRGIQEHDTSGIERKALQRLWRYLMRHSDALDGRKSSIYENRPRFSVFGIGPYSYSPWKVAISGLYKRISFMLVPPCDALPVMVDDTCYSIPCRSKEEAELLYVLLSCSQAIDLLELANFSSIQSVLLQLMGHVDFPLLNLPATLISSRNWNSLLNWILSVKRSKLRFCC